MRFSDLHEGKTIIHVVGGRMNEDLAQNMDKIAQWFVDNDITLLWGDDYHAQFDQNHPVAILAEEIVRRGGNVPIRVLQMGKNMPTPHDPDFVDFLEPLYDDNNTLIGYHDLIREGEYTIYTAQQQDRQKAYYNNADALMVLNGGIGAAYEIPNAIIYGFSQDLPTHFQIIVIDDYSTHKFGESTSAYLRAGGLTMEDLPQLKYYASAEKFTKEIKSQITTEIE